MFQNRRGRYVVSTERFLFFLNYSLSFQTVKVVETNSERTPKEPRKIVKSVYHFTGYSEISESLKKELFGDFGGINAREKVGECRSPASRVRGKT